MLSTLYLLKYNNYYNRILKKENNLGEYSEFIIGSPLTGINFNPNDGITTRQVINWTNDIPDYVLVCEDTTIVSRWFVIESKRLRNGQFELELFRDTLADYLDDLRTAPMFIEKGYCSIDDSAIYNDENITVNSIKNREIELKDPTGCAWVVGYCALKDAEETEPTKIEYGSASDIYDYWSASLEDWPLSGLVGTSTKIKFPKNVVYDFRACTKRAAEAGRNYSSLTFTKDGPISIETVGAANASYMTVETPQLLYNNISKGTQDNLYNTTLTYYGLSDDLEIYEQLQELSTKANKAKILKVGTGSTATYYKITLHRSEQSQTDKTPQTNDAMYQAWVNWLNSVGSGLEKGPIKLGSLRTNILSENFYIELTQTTPFTGLEFYFPWGRKSLVDAPYCMFALPYGNIDVLYNDNNTGKSFTTNKDNALSVAAGIAKSLGKKLYDIQLLPYCPIPTLRNSEYPDTVNFKTAPLSNWTLNEHYVLIESAKQVLFFCEQSTDSFNIDVSNYGLYSFQDSLTFKINMLTQSVRLCSPNYNGVFEFNTFKNKGIQYINVDYTYKPFQPYIHLNPNFGGLYGKDFDDARGLICGGDFSLPITSDAWIDYQLTNKTYQEQFNRKIENMEVQHKYQRIQQIAGVATGTISGATTGLAAGSLYGGGSPIGAGIGAAVGGAMSLGGGIADIAISDKLRDEAKDYTKDMFSLELENIKALPDGLTRVSAFNANNKIFPFLELYTATEQEILAVSNKLVYNGFTIGRPDTLENMISNKPAYLPLGYVKGQLIRLESISDDFHIVNTIASELYKGVYV